MFDLHCHISLIKLNGGPHPIAACSDFILPAAVSLPNSDINTVACLLLIIYVKLVVTAICIFNYATWDCMSLLDDEKKKNKKGG